MRKSLKITTSLMAIGLGMLLFARPVMAEGNLNVAIDKETCELGESVSVTIEAQIPDDSAVPPQIGIEYNPNRLQFDNCSCEYGGGGGGLITLNEKSATIDFTTLSGGNAEIKVAGILSEDSGEIESTSVTVAVNGEDTAVGTDAAPASSTGVESTTIDTGDGRVIQSVFADEFMPSLFHKETCDYQGQTVECARFDMGDMTLVYSSDFSGNDGKFMIYNTATGEMSDFRMIQGIENRFIIVLNECEGDIPSGYTKAVLDWNGQTLTAYMNMDAANGTAPTFGNLSASDFFLVYGLSSEGNRGWYQYDQNEGTYQRFFALAGEGAGNSSADSDDEADSNEKTFLDEYLSRKVQMILLLVFAALTLILLVVVIVLAVKKSGYDDYYQDDYYGDEEDDEDDDDRDGRTRKTKSGTITAASIVTSQMGEIPDDEDEEDDEDEDDSDEDDEEDEPEDSDEEDDEDDEEDDEDEEEEERYLSRRELKEAKREEKWRQKEEKRAAKQRAKGYEEATPMDWSSFKKDDSVRDDEEDQVEEDEAEEEVVPPYVSEKKREALPPRKKVINDEQEAEKRAIAREEEQRERQKRLFEQQQRIEQQQQLEKQRREEEQKREQQQFISSQQMDEDLDEDFQFEFLNL